MSIRSKAAGSGAPRRRRPGPIALALTALLMTWTIASGVVRAERIVLKSGEVVEGSIIDATRNTVIIERSIGGMRQMRIQDIEEVRFDLTQGQEVVGQFLSWAEGVYQVRSGDQIVRISEGGILSREARQEAVRQRPRRPLSQPTGQQTVTAAATRPTPGAGQAAEPVSEGQNQIEAAADAASSAAADAETEAAADAESQTAGDQAGDAASQTASDAESQAAGDAESRTVAGNEGPPVGDQGSPAVKASVDPSEPGARSMVFKIELSQPAEQTVVLIYGTVDGTAKAGKDYEAKQGMVTLAPGVRSAEVQVPLIEGQPENGEKRFELVLMADPKVAEVVDRRVTATIKGAD